MSRRLFVVIATAASLAAPLAHAERKAADEACTPDARDAAAQAQTIDVHALFARENEPVDANTIRSAGMDVVLARIGADGKPVLGCVSNEEAARRFLTSPQPARRAQEK